MQQELGSTVDFELLKSNLKTCIIEQFQKSFRDLETV